MIPRLAALLALCDAFVRAPPSLMGTIGGAALRVPRSLRLASSVIDLTAPEHNRGRGGDDADVVPLMLLRCSYLPGATEVPLNFIEPRMREMCRDTDRFVVAFAPDETLAACCGVGVVFELRSRTEETHCPRPKTVGVSDVAPRPFAIRRVLNGRRHADPSEYLLAEIEPLRDDDESEERGGGATADAADSALAALTEIVGLRRELAGTTARAAPAAPADDAVVVLPALAAATEWASAPERDGSLWNLARRWQAVCERLSGEAIARMRAEIDGIAMDHMMAQPGPLNLPIKLERDLPPDVLARARRAEKRWRDEIEAMDLEPNAPFQRLVEAPNRAARARALTRMIENERNRLRAKRALRDLFPDLFEY